MTSALNSSNSQPKCGVAITSHSATDRRSNFGGNCPFIYRKTSVFSSRAKFLIKQFYFQKSQDLSIFCLVQDFICVQQLLYFLKINLPPSSGPKAPKQFSVNTINTNEYSLYTSVPRHYFHSKALLKSSALYLFFLTDRWVTTFSTASAMAFRA